MCRKIYVTLVCLGTLVTQRCICIVNLWCIHTPSASLPPFQWPFSRLTCVSQFIHGFWATVCKTVRSMLSDHCPDCLPVCNVGILWPNGWMDQDETWRGSRPRPWSHCGRWGPSSPQKGHSPQFLAHVCCGQTAGWIKMPLGLEVGLSPGHIMLDGDPAPPTGHSPSFLARVFSGQTTGWIKMPLGTEVDLSPGYIALDGDPAPPEKGAAAPLFSAHVCCGQTVANLSYW